MARITVEDCVRIVPNRFELCLIASNRAKSILSGAPTTLDRKEKPSVISLREIADGLVAVDNIKDNILSALKNRGFSDEIIKDEQVIESVNEEIESYVAEQIESNEPEETSSEESFSSENLEVED